MYDAKNAFFPSPLVLFGGLQRFATARHSRDGACGRSGHDFCVRDVCADEACDSFYVVAPYDNIEALPLKLSVDVKEMLAKEVLLDDRCTILLCKAQELRSWSTVKRNVCDFSALPFGQGFSLTQALRMEKGKLQVLEE